MITMEFIILEKRKKKTITETGFNYLQLRQKVRNDHKRGRIISEKILSRDGGVDNEDSNQ